MKNYVQAGNVLTVPAPYALASGSGALVREIFGVAAETVPQGAMVDLAVVGVFTLPKVANLSLDVGSLLFWDDTARLVTTTPDGNHHIGVATIAVPNPSSTVDVRLAGAF